MSGSERHVELGTSRDAPPHFAGRVAELASLNRRIDAVCASANPEAGMSLITGVQGVGKTHLGLKFAREATKREGPRRILWKSMLPDTLAADDAIVFMAIMRALGSEPIGRKVADLEARTTAVGGGIGPIKGNVAVDRVRKAHDLGELLNDSVVAGAWEGKALVITIDELQTVASAGMRTLRVLHQGVQNCPMMVLGIGLQHTPEVLSNPGGGAAGISRVAEEFNLGPLSRPETLEAIDQGMLALGHDIPQPGVQALAEASMGFPAAHPWIPCRRLRSHFASWKPHGWSAVVGSTCRRRQSESRLLRRAPSSHVQQQSHVGCDRCHEPTPRALPGHRLRNPGIGRGVVRRCRRGPRSDRARCACQKRSFGIVLRASRRSTTTCKTGWTANIRG